MKTKKTALWGIFILVSVLLGTGAAQAENYAFFVGDRAAGLAGAITALANDGSSVYYNPAGLARLKGATLSLNANTYQIAKLKSDEFAQIKSGDSYQNFNFKQDNFAIIPTAVVYTSDLGSVAGMSQVGALSILVPDMTTLSYFSSMKPAEWQARMMDALRGETKTYYLGPSYALAINNQLRVGASLFLVYSESSVEMQQGYYVGLQDGTFYDDLEVFNYKQRTYAYATNFGAQYDISDKLKVGLRFTPPSINLSAKQDIVTARTTVNFNGGVTHMDPYEANDTNKDMDSLTPGNLSLGIGYEEPGQWAAALDLDYFHELNSERKISVVNVKLGGEYYLKPQMPVRLGFYTDFSNDTELDDISIEERGMLPGMLRNLDVYGITGSFSFPTMGATKSGADKSLKDIHTTIGFQFGVVDGKINGMIFDADEITQSRPANQDIGGTLFNVFIAESVAF